MLLVFTRKLDPPRGQRKRSLTKTCLPDSFEIIDNNFTRYLQKLFTGFFSCRLRARLSMPSQVVKRPFHCRLFFPSGLFSYEPYINLSRESIREHSALYFVHYSSRLLSVQSVSQAAIRLAVNFSTTRLVKHVPLSVFIKSKSLVNNR